METGLDHLLPQMSSLRCLRKPCLQIPFIFLFKYIYTDRFILSHSNLRLSFLSWNESLMTSGSVRTVCTRYHPLPLFPLPAFATHLLLTPFFIQLPERRLRS